MPCFLVIAALMAPRLVAALVFFFGNAFGQALPHPQLLFGILGFMFAPYSLLTYTAVMTWGDGQWNLLQIIFMVIAVMVDMSAHKESSRQARSRG